MKQAEQGFTLIELMIAVVVIGILSAIAIPSYRSYVQKAERTAAKGVMLNISQTEERYYTNNGTYAAVAAAPVATTSGFQNYSGSSVATMKYSIAVTAGSIANTSAALTDAYTITGTPVTTDALCGILQLDSTGAKAASGTGGIAQCW